MLAHTDINGLILLVIGLLIRYQIGRRRFNRRSLAGVQMYRGYFIGLITSIFERILNLFAKICIIIGVVILML